MAATPPPDDTPTMARVISEAIEGRLTELYTTLPGTIDSYSDATGFADVAPSLMRQYRDGTVKALPVIKNVPVQFPRGGGALLKFALQKGDEVLLHFSQRSLERWKATGGLVDPKDSRKFALSDAFATPGATSAANPPGAATVTAAFTALGLKVSNAIGNWTFQDNADVTFDTGTVQGLFGSGGKVKFTNAIGELISTLYDLMTDIQSGTTVTMLGPEPLVMPTFAAHLTKLLSFKA